MVNNTLGDLNNFLFAQLERLDNEELKGEELKEEMESAEKCECISRELCEYCVSGVCGNETIYDEMDRGFMAHVRDGILNIGVATANFHEHSEFKINYCPMCGRKLEEQTC